ncbi:hypothetical protein J2X08_002427 [Rhizobium rosettiformans]|nr:hypothetical protein [Rhizobium rosettiformans]
MRPNPLHRPDDASREERAQGRHDKAAAARPTSPLMGEVAAKRRVGVARCPVCSRVTPPRSSAPTLPLKGRVDTSRRPSALVLRRERSDIRRTRAGGQAGPRSFEALALRGRLRMKRIAWSHRHERHRSAPSDDPPALVPRHRPSPPTSPLRGEVAAKRRVGVTTSPAASRFTPPRKLLASPSP